MDSKKDLNDQINEIDDVEEIACLKIANDLANYGKIAKHVIEN